MTRFGNLRVAILQPRSALNNVGVVLVTLAAATALRWALGRAADPVPFVTYFPAIMLCALFAGWRVALANMVFAALIVNLVFLPEPMHVTNNAESAAMIGLFFCSSLLLIAIAQALRNTLAEAVVDKERAEFLGRELQHRGRNTIAIIQALAQQTMRSDPHNFMSSFSSRLTALASAQDILSQSSGSSCDLSLLVRQSCAAFTHEGNFAFQGPSCTLPADTCVPLSLALHELCTNAVKHGGLSIPSGRVDVCWTAACDGKVQFVWTESGGPTVKPPTRKGLGSVLLASQPQLGKVDLHFHPDGLRCEMTLRVLQG